LAEDHSESSSRRICLQCVWLTWFYYLEYQGTHKHPFQSFKGSLTFCRTQNLLWLPLSSEVRWGRCHRGIPRDKTTVITCQAKKSFDIPLGLGSWVLLDTLDLGWIWVYSSSSYDMTKIVDLLLCKLAFRHLQG